MTLSLSNISKSICTCFQDQDPFSIQFGWTWLFPRDDLSRFLHDGRGVDVLWKTVVISQFKKESLARKKNLVRVKIFAEKCFKKLNFYQFFQHFSRRKLLKECFKSNWPSEKRKKFFWKIMLQREHLFLIYEYLVITKTMPKLFGSIQNLIKFGIFLKFTKLLEF